MVAEVGIITWSRSTNKNNEICVYNESDFYGVEIPEETNLIFTGELYDDNGGVSRIGDYTKRDMRIRLQVLFRNLTQIQSSLRHELAHHEYRYNLSTYDKQLVKTRYDLFCDNPSEFYAYTIENYGEFKW